eukprot:50846-Rhodomonas_salina.2
MDCKQGDDDEEAGWIGRKGRREEGGGEEGRRREGGGKEAGRGGGASMIFNQPCLEVVEAMPKSDTCSPQYTASVLHAP